MKIRITGTKPELDAIKAVLWSRFKEQIISISNFYPNRGMTNEGRIYIETTTQSFMGFDKNNFALEFKI